MFFPFFRSWPHSRSLSRDFGSPKDWFIKDCLLFTPPPTTATPSTSPQHSPPATIVYHHHHHHHHHHQNLVSSPTVNHRHFHHQHHQHRLPGQVCGGGGDGEATARTTTMPKLYDTGFGCLKLQKLRINGDFVFPPLAKRCGLLRMNVLIAVLADFIFSPDTKSSPCSTRRSRGPSWNMASMLFCPPSMTCRESP